MMIKVPHYPANNHATALKIHKNNNPQAWGETQNEENLSPVDWREIVDIDAQKKGANYYKILGVIKQEMWICFAST